MLCKLHLNKADLRKGQKKQKKAQVSIKAHNLLCGEEG